MTTNNTTRRALLGSIALAAPAAAMAVSAGASAAPVTAADRSAWNSAKEMQRRTLIVRDRFDRDVLSPSAHRYMKLRDSFGPLGAPLTADQRAQIDALGHDGDQERYDELHGAHLDAYGAMLLTPAPDVAALAYKLEQIEAQDMYGLDRGDELQIMEALIADARRLAKEA